MKDLIIHKRVSIKEAKARPSGIPSAYSLRKNTYLRIILTCALIALATSVVIWKTAFLFAIAATVTPIMVFVAWTRITAAIMPKPEPQTGEPEDYDWPAYTVLVPLYKEANVVGSLIQHLSKLDYPEDKLEIFLICEADDHETLVAINLPANSQFKLIKVPPSQPRTKPKALNHAMRFASGEILTIYDAEDRPHPGQLKAAATALNLNPNWAGVQAPLDYYNSHENLLTRQFAIEYAALFHVWLPFLSQCGLPFPLGGTSNHIRSTALEQTHGWDAYNVTEDADMSFRLAAKGWTLGYIHPSTDEEAVQNIRPWIGQRSRWMKGFIQTWLVHMSKPLSPGGAQGLKRQFTLQLTIGFTLLAGLLHVPSLIGLGIIFGLGLSSVMSGIFVGTMSLGYIAGMLIGAVGVIRTGKPSLLWHVPLMPFYWLLLFAPTLIAIYELVVRPFYWSKTEHGVTDAAPKTETPDKDQVPCSQPISQLL